MKASVVAPLNSIKYIDKLIESGANELYFGVQGTLNSRNFTGLNLILEDLPILIKKCHENNISANLVLNSFPSSEKDLKSIEQLIKKSSDLGVDCMIVASFSVMELVKKINPHMPIHVSVMSAISNPESINFLATKFNIRRVIQAPDKSIEEIRDFVNKLDKRISLEIIGFGTLSYGFQGNCDLGKFMSGIETNTTGVCSHPNFLSAKTNGKESTLYFRDIAFTKFINNSNCDLTCFNKGTGEELLKKEQGHGWKNTALVNKRYVCRGKYLLGDKEVTFQDYEYLNVLDYCNELIDAGVRAFKIEGRQRPTNYSVKVSKLFSDTINKGKYSKKELKEVEKIFFPEMKAFQGGLLYA